MTVFILLSILGFSATLFSSSMTLTDEDEYSPVFNSTVASWLFSLIMVIYGSYLLGSS